MSNATHTTEINDKLYKLNNITERFKTEDLEKKSITAHTLQFCIDQLSYLFPWISREVESTQDACVVALTTASKLLYEHRLNVLMRNAERHISTY